MSINAQTTAPATEPLDTRSLSERTYGLVMNDILSGRLAPGQQIDIDRMAADLHISRTPIKESLSRLAAEGLVDIVPRRGSFVAASHPERLLELLDVRRMLEVGCCDAIVARVDADAVATLQLELEKLRRFHSAEEWRARVNDFVTLDQAFHTRFVSLAGNQELDRLYRQLHVHMHIGRLYYPTATLNLERTMLEHEAIVDATIARDAALLARAVDDHILRVRAFIAATLPASPQR